MTKLNGYLNFLIKDEIKKDMNNWIKVILKPDDTIKKAIEVIDKEIYKIVLVANEEGVLLGTVTDGDIRRAIINEFQLSNNLANIMQLNPISASIDDQHDQILSMMENQSILQIPIIDKSGVIVGLETLKSLLEVKKFNNPVVLMAGGFGKRLLPLTYDTPKPLLKIGSKPILETILENFIQAGFHNFYISTHYKPEMISAYFADGSKWGVTIKYIHEENPLGTGGALGLLPKDIIDLPILLMNGDLVTNINYNQLLNFHLEQKGIATMCVREFDYQVPYGVVQSEECYLTSIDEKPIKKFFVNAGIYVIEPKIINEIEPNVYIDMTTLLERQIFDSKKVSTFPLHESWSDIGQQEDFDRANKEYYEKNIDN